MLFKDNKRSSGEQKTIFEPLRSVRLLALIIRIAMDLEKILPNSLNTLVRAIFRRSTLHTIASHREALDGT